MAVMMAASQLIVGSVSAVQRDARPLLPHHTGTEAGGPEIQLPVEHVTEGDVLGPYSTPNRGATSFHATSRYLTTNTSVSSGITVTAQRAITEYQSFAQLGKGQLIPLQNVDEYV